MYVSPNKVNTMGVDRAITAKVEGTSSTEVYLTEDAKTVCSNSGSSLGFSLAKAGNKAVEMGTDINDKRTAKLRAAE